MRIILTGGCTGGHIYPALAIGDKFIEHDQDTEILYVGSADGLESEIVPRHGFELKLVKAKWVDRSNMLKLAETLWVTEVGTAQAYKIMKKFKPDVVISTGSFVSVPVVMAAKRYGAKIFLHEQNAYPGLANKFLARYAEKVFLGFAPAEKYFKDKSKVEYVGNPVRKDFYGIDRSEARKVLGLPEDALVILAFGGSLGARTINEVAHTLVREYIDQENVHILFGTGRNYYDEVKEALIAEGLYDKSNLHVMPYIQDMANTLAASNVVISRSGALSVAEITMSGRAGIFIPSPNVTGDHQYYNAKAVVDNGGAIIVREDDDTADRVKNAFREFIKDPQILKDMEAASFASAPVSATDKIYESIMEVCAEKN